jgi:hypothetical protein
MKSNYVQNLIKRTLILVLFLPFSQIGFAQNVPVTQQMPDTAQMTYNQISQACKLYVFPSKGQSQQQQKKDEFECYKWAMEQSGVDPLNLPKVEAAPAQPVQPEKLLAEQQKEQQQALLLEQLPVMPVKALPLALLLVAYGRFGSGKTGSGTAKPTVTSQCCGY